MNTTDTTTNDVANSNVLMQFVRDRKGNPRGVVVATVNDQNEVTLGWSYTNIKAGDRFNKKRGIDIALGRVKTGTDAQVPHNVQKVSDRMYRRALIYFKKPIQLEKLIDSEFGI